MKKISERLFWLLLGIGSVGIGLITNDDTSKIIGCIWLGISAVVGSIEDNKVTIVIDNKNINNTTEEKDENTTTRSNPTQ